MHGDRLEFSSILHAWPRVRHKIAALGMFVDTNATEADIKADRPLGVIALMS